MTELKWKVGLGNIN